MNTHPQLQSRRGNALVLVMAVSIMVAAMIFSTTESGVSSMQMASKQVRSPEVVAALEVVLRRREAMISEAAGQGGPGLVRRFDPRYADPAVFLGESNYGMDPVGQVEVYWRIEPLSTRQSDALGNAIPWVQNPPPDPAVAPALAAGERDNSVVYIFKISAEARLYGANGDIALRAQGARYAAVQMEPLFRYVIFYAKEGPAGDLELTHADPVTIAGSVHSNGSIYMGGGLRVNDTLGRLGPLDRNLQPSSTTIGPDSANRPVAVTAADGIFRLHKPLLYSIINDYPITSDVSANSGVNPSGISWLKADALDLSMVPTPNTRYVEGPNSSVASLTNNGTLINPWRVRDVCGAITNGAQGTGSSLSYSLTDARQVINAVPIRGRDQSSSAIDQANDGRQPEWPQLSAQTALPGFSGRVKDSRSGGRIIRLPPLLQNRAFEPQQIETLDQPHQHQRPLFVQAGTTTTTFPAANPVIEAAGQYLRYAIGQSDIHFVRKPTGDGWFYGNASGVSSGGTSLASKVGLIIRERMIPDTALWPGTGQVGTQVPSGHPRYLPYAYGKHWYPVSFPFTPMDLSDALHQRINNNTSYPGSAWLNHGTSTALRRHYYDGAQGSVVITAACAPGPRRSDDTGTTTTTGFAPWGTQWNWTTTAPANDSARAALYAQTGGSPSYSPRKPYFYSENWRFVHLRSATAASLPGWTATQFNDQNRPTPATTYSSVSNEIFHSMLGQPANTGVVAVASPTAAHGSALTPLSASPNYQSYRWESMLVPTTTAVYTFAVSSGNCRVFVDGDLVVDSWFNATQGLNAPLVTSKSLVAGATVSVVVEAYKATTTPSLSLTWRAAHWGSSAVIPTAPAANSADSGKMYQRSNGVGFDRNRFTAVQALVRNTTPGLSAAKYGLMIRDGGGGASPLMSGADRYLMVGWSPTRGVFSQRRLERAFQTEHTLGNQFYIGAGSGPSGAADATGVVLDDSLSVASVNRIATLVENPASRPAVQLSAVTYPTRTNTGTPSWAGTTTPVSVPDLDLGGGKVWTFAGTIAKGTYTGSRTQSIDKRQAQTAFQILTYTLTSAVAGFISSDITTNPSRRIRIFNNSTGTSLYGTASADNQPFSNSTAYTSAGLVPPSINQWYVFGSTTAPWTQLRRRYEYIRYGAWFTGTTANQSTGAVGGPSTLWYTGSAPTITKIGVVGPATIADINTMTGGAYTQLLPLPTVSTPGGITWTPAPATPADSSAPAITDTGVPTLPDFSAGRTLQIQRAGSTVRFDLNSFITRLGTWFNPGVDQYAPWVASWGAITTAVAETGGFRPDFYRGPAAPTVAITSSENNGGGSTWQNGTSPWQMGDDVSVAGATQMWLRIERDSSSGQFKLRYYSGALTAPAPSDFTDLLTNIALPSTWSTSLLLGPCVQSGDAQTPATAEFANLRIETSEVADGVIDANDWNAQIPSDSMARYLSSQYQVFFGGAEITEDFFSWRSALSATTGCASEDWFYQPREFWSQSRWWEHRSAAAPTLPIDKDAQTFTDYTNRSLLAKTTVLTLNMDIVQDYLRQRTVSQATKTPLSNPLAASAITNGGTLRTFFNGLLYAHRSNRYPWNPASDPELATPAALNPWSPSASLTLPNGGVNLAENVTNGTALHSWAPANLLHQSVHKLQPYALTHAPAFKPQHFHHGVRIARASNIDWGYADTGTLSAGNVVHASTPTFGTCKLSIVTPNQLYVLGDLNTVTHRVSANSSTPNKVTPMAIMGDVIIFQSNSWSKSVSNPALEIGDLNYQADGLTVSNVAGASSVSGAGTLAASTLGTAASSTTYNAAIVTHNIPTTKARVAEGQAAPFIDTVQFLENWNGATMTYRGSLVVLDTRRYTEAFLHDATKKYGRTPFGTAAQGGWTAIHGPADWLGQSPVIYSEPLRVYAFNEDFLTAEGTPPFTPFGMTLDGIGSWSRVMR